MPLGTSFDLVSCGVVYAASVDESLGPDETLVAGASIDALLGEAVTSSDGAVAYASFGTLIEE